MTPDQPLSLAIAIVGTILSIVLPRRWAIAPLALTMCAYPSILLIPPPGLSLTPQRLIALVLLGRCIIQPSVRRQFRWRLVDTAAAIYFFLITLSMLLSSPKAGLVLNNRAGFFLSAMVPFWCVRFLIVDRPSFYCLLKTWVWAAMPLACLGLYQMQTGKSPYFSIMQYGGVLWGFIRERINDKRLFLGQMHFRAFAPFMQFIMFGWFFGILVTPCTNLFWQKRSLIPWIIPWLFLPLGAISSISSGPMTGAAISFAIAMCFPLRRYWKIAVGTVALAYVVTMFGSNRGLMEIIASFGTVDPASSWYRVSLQRFTLHGGMSGHWFSGYGEVPPVYDEFHDLCIHWIWLLVIHGVMGLVGFYGLVATCASSLWKGKSKAQTLEDQWLLWTLMATLVATLLGMLLVTLFSEMYFIYHMFLAILANSDIIVGNGQSAAPGAGVRHVTLLVEHDGRKVALRYALKPGQKLALVRPARATSK